MFQVTTDYFGGLTNEGNYIDALGNKYSISKENADKIVNAIRAFANEMYNQKLNGTLLNVKKDFPTDAMKYNRNK